MVDEAVAQAERDLRAVSAQLREQLIVVRRLRYGVVALHQDPAALDLVDQVGRMIVATDRFLANGERIARSWAVIVEALTDPTVAANIVARGVARDSINSGRAIVRICDALVTRFGTLHRRFREQLSMRIGSTAACSQ